MGDAELAPTTQPGSDEPQHATALFSFEKSEESYCKITRGDQLVLLEGTAVPCPRLLVIYLSFRRARRRMVASAESERREGVRSKLLRSVDSNSKIVNSCYNLCTICFELALLAIYKKERKEEKKLKIIWRDKTCHLKFQKMLRNRDIPAHAVDLLLEYCSRFDQLSSLITTLETLKFGTSYDSKLKQRIQAILFSFFSVCSIYNFNCSCLKLSVFWLMLMNCSKIFTKQVMKGFWITWMNHWRPALQHFHQMSRNKIG